MVRRKFLKEKIRKTNPLIVKQSSSQASSDVKATCFNTSPWVLRFSLKQSSLGSVGFSVGSTIGSVVVLFDGREVGSSDIGSVDMSVGSLDRCPKAHSTVLPVLSVGSVVILSVVVVASVVSLLVVGSVVSRLVVGSVVSLLVVGSVVSRLVVGSVVSLLVVGSVVSRLVVGSVVSLLVVGSVSSLVLISR